MSPTLFWHKNFRFFFFSREEARMHVHVSSPEGEAKFWLEPTIALADFCQLNKRVLNELQKVVEERTDEIKQAWKKHFRS